MLRILVYILSFVGAQIFSGLLAMLYLMVSEGLTQKDFTAEFLSSRSVELGVAMLIVEGAFIAFFFLAKLVRRQCLRNTVSLHTWSWTILATLAFSQGLGFLVSPLELNDGGTTAMFTNMLASPLAVLSITVVGPIFEELICREGIQRTLRNAGNKPWVAIVIASALFGLVHGNLYQGLTATLFGCFLGFLYERSQTALLPIGAHVLNNAVSVVFLCFPTFNNQLNTLSLSVALPIGGLLLAVGAVSVTKIKQLT